MKNEELLQKSYNLQNPWYRDSKEPVEQQLLQATLAIMCNGTHFFKPEDMIRDVRLARDLLTTIRMNEADCEGTLMLDDLDPAL